MLQTYELHVYSATKDGDLSREPVEIIKMPCFNEASARSAARKLARQHQAPIDVARAGAAPWADRYVGTAAPVYPYTDCKITEFEKLC